MEKRVHKTTRRKFFQIVAAATAAGVLKTGKAENSSLKSGKPDHKRLKLGLASYTFRKFNLDDTLAMTQRVGLNRISLKNFHLPLESTPQEIKNTARKIKQLGLELYGCGVVYMKTASEVDRAFDYAKAADIKVIIGVPEHDLLELVNKKVQEYDLRLAIHNHGPGDERYPTPQSAYMKIKEMDQRMGLCLDIGHVKRLGMDPVDSAQKYAERLHDIHIKDVTSATAEGRTTEIGRGVIDIPRFLNTLLKINYQGTVAFEYEKDELDPLPGVAESVGYVKGILSVI
jgi:sugar phosphate isomerase/epimerase